MICKFNGGRGAILCNECGVVVAQGAEIDHLVMDNIIPNINSAVAQDNHVFCSKECRDKFFDKLKNNSVILNR